MSGKKYDNGKPRFSLIPVGTLAKVIQVLEFGAQKYAADNWKKVPDARTRYFDAAYRHIVDKWWNEGEKIDPETGLPHLAHGVCCLLFLMWIDDNPTSAVKGPANAE